MSSVQVGQLTTCGIIGEVAFMESLYWNPGMSTGIGSMAALFSTYICAAFGLSRIAAVRLLQPTTAAFLRSYFPEEGIDRAGDFFPTCNRGVGVGSDRNTRPDGLDSPCPGISKHRTLNTDVIDGDGGAEMPGRIHRRLHPVGSALHGGPIGVPVQEDRLGRIRFRSRYGQHSSIQRRGLIDRQGVSGCPS